MPACRPRPRPEGSRGGRMRLVSWDDLSLHFFKGCSSNLRTNNSNPSDCSKILPATGTVLWQELTVLPLTRIVIESPRQRHSTRVHSPTGLSTSCLPRVSSSSLYWGSWLAHQSWPCVNVRD